MQQIEPLNYGKFYHIYNRGTNHCNLFDDRSNYVYFLSLYENYIVPVADTFAWVLMKNHFHFLVRIKEEKEINFISEKTLSGFKTAERVETAPSVVLNPDGGCQKKYIPSHQFSHLFNAYAQAYNKRNKRTGSLFEHPFHRKEITDQEYLKTMVVYIHNNPVHHKFTNYAMEYPWSSYRTSISVNSTYLQRDTVIGWFEDMANFKMAHDNPENISGMENWEFHP
jgi:putative transposase